MEKTIELELNRLEALSDVRLYQVLEALDSDPAPKWVKDRIVQKINSIFNKRIGLPE